MAKINPESINLVIFSLERWDLKYKYHYDYLRCEYVFDVYTEDYGTTHYSFTQEDAYRGLIRWRISNMLHSLLD